MAEQYPELIILEGTGTGKRFSLDRKKTRIGRSNENEIIINDRLSSRVHTEIREVDGVYYLSDMDSRNGTKLNGNNIQENEELHNNDEITIGTTTFEFRYRGASSSSKSSSYASEFSEDDFTIEEEESIANKGFDWKTILLVPLAIIAILVVYFYLNQEEKHTQLPVIQLPSSFAYGYIPNSDQKHADKVVFSFKYVAGDLYLSYKVWDIDRRGEVNIYLNREKIEEVEQTESGHWSGLRRLKLPPELIHKDKLNYIVFDNPRNPPQTLMWGVAEVKVAPEESYECNVQKAKQAYELGKKSYEDKLVVKSNLYHSIEKFKEADLYLKNCNDKPEFYFDNKLKLDDATRELNNQYKNHLFEFYKNKRLRLYDQAEIELRFLDALIPNPEDERHIKIKREERYLMSITGGK